MDDGAPPTTGQRGEDAAAAHLQAMGYRVIARNLRVAGVETDIVALTPEGAVAVVEVKSRRGPWPPEERVDARKQQRLSRAALALSERSAFRDRRFQFDVVAVNLVDGLPPRVRHWPCAFDASAPGP